MISKATQARAQDLLNAARTDEAGVGVSVIETKRKGSHEPVYLLAITVRDSGGVAVIPVAEMIPDNTLDSRYIDPSVAMDMDRAKNG